MQDRDKREPNMPSDQSRSTSPPLDARARPVLLSGTSTTQEPVKRSTKWYRSTVFIVLLLILIPPLGLIFMWLAASWKRYVKVIVTLPIIFTSAVFLLIPALIFQSIQEYGSLLNDESIKMERFLEQKYNKDFVVKNGRIEGGGDIFFGVSFKTYKADVAPVNDPDKVFAASRIVEGQSLDGGANSPDKLNYYDDYLLRLWTQELQDRVKGAIAKQSIDVFESGFHVGLTKDRAGIARFYEKIWGTTPTYKELPFELKRELTLATHVKVTGSMTMEGVEKYAATMIAIRDSLDPNRQGLAVQVNSFEVYSGQEGSEQLGKWQSVGFVQLAKIESIDELTPYFIKWTDGYGKYYNPKTRLFDIDHPK